MTTLMRQVTHATMAVKDGEPSRVDVSYDADAAGLSITAASETTGFRAALFRTKAAADSRTTDPAKSKVGSHDVGAWLVIDRVGASGPDCEVRFKIGTSTSGPLVFAVTGGSPP